MTLSDRRSWPRYSVTVRRSCKPTSEYNPECPDCNVLEHHVSLSRDEVRGLVEDVVFEAGGEPVAAVIPDGSCSVGPLSDGTRIDIERSEQQDA